MNTHFSVVDDEDGDDSSEGDEMIELSHRGRLPASVSLWPTIRLHSLNSVYFVENTSCAQEKRKMETRNKETMQTLNRKILCTEALNVKWSAQYWFQKRSVMCVIGV